MNAEQLYENLKEIQGAKGYHFNDNMAFTIPLLDSLLTNKERYGYMACPCRLASGTIDIERDIVCPCEYREPDLAEYGSCYCGLYVTKEYNDNKTEFTAVPERRPSIW